MLEKDGNPGERGIFRELDLIPRYSERVDAIIRGIIAKYGGNTEQRWKKMLDVFFGTLFSSSLVPRYTEAIIAGGVPEYPEFQNILMEISKHNILEGDAPEDFLLLMRENPTIFLRKAFIHVSPEIQSVLRKRVVLLEENQQIREVNMIRDSFLNPEPS